MKPMLFLIYSDYLLAENTVSSTTITDMNFRIRMFNFCTSNCTPYPVTVRMPVTSRIPCAMQLPPLLANDKFAIFGYSFYLDIDFYIFRAIK